MNKVILTGRTTQDIELRYSQNNIAYASFNLAVQKDYKNQNGVYETDFINCVVSNKLAETMQKYVKKGNKIGIEGKIQTRNYTLQDSSKKYITEVKITNIEFLESKKEESKTPSDEVLESTVNNMAKAEEDPFAVFGEEVVLDESDLPF